MRVSILKNMKNIFLYYFFFCNNNKMVVRDNIENREAHF
jgi:hypothetical protein